MKELDRILDGDDVIRALLVDLINDGGQGGGLARPGRPGHEYEPPRLVTEGVYDLGQPQLLDRLDDHRHQPERRAESPPLEIRVHPETPQPKQRVREIDLPLR